MSKTKVMSKLPHIRCDWCGEMNEISAADYYADKFICEACEKPNDITVILGSRKGELEK